MILAQTDEAQAHHKAAALAEAIAEQPLRWGEFTIPVTAAYGVYAFSGSDDPQHAIEAADRAMYQQKRATVAGRRPDPGSGDDVGEQLAFDLRDLVLQQQLALFEALHLQLIERAALGDAGDHVVEVAVLGLEGGELGFEGFDVEIHRASAPFAAASRCAVPLAI